MESKTTINTTTAVWHSEPKVHMPCPKCGEAAEVDTSIVLTSIPPQYNWYCPHCGAHSSIQCDEVQVIDPKIWATKRARFARHCEICGD